MDQESFDVLGLGNALLDIQVEATDDLLKKLNVDKASMQLVEAEHQAGILASLLRDKHLLEKSSGGCAANTLAGIASFGGRTHLFAKLGKDENAQHYLDDLKNVGVNFVSSSDPNFPTGTCLALITPDAERTMMTSLGAAQKLGPNDIQEDFIARAQIIYLEGYLWDSPTGKEACEKALQLAKKHKKKVALTLSDAHCVERHYESFSHFVRNEIDILFCNESEATTLTQNQKIDSAFNDLKNIVESVFVSVGPHGALLSSDKGKTTRSIGTWDVQLVDKLGAGDLFAAGVLFGLSRNKSLIESGYLGCYAATRVIQQMSARIREPLQNNIELALQGPGEKSTKPIHVMSA